jgi:hypothetical protein
MVTKSNKSADSCRGARTPGSSHTEAASAGTKTVALERARAGPPPLPPRSPVGATDREGKGTTPRSYPDLLTTRRATEMTTRDDGYASNVSVASGRKPDMTATAFSFTGQVTRSSTDSIHRNYLTRHPVIGFPQLAASTIPSNAQLWILVPRPRDKHELLELKYPARRVIRYGDKQCRPMAANPSELFSNSFPFDTESLSQWRERRRHAPARMVPRIV